MKVLKICICGCNCTSGSVVPHDDGSREETGVCSCSRSWSRSASSMMACRTCSPSTVTIRLPTTWLLSSTSTTAEQRDTEDQQEELRVCLSNVCALTVQAGLNHVLLSLQDLGDPNEGHPDILTLLLLLLFLWRLCDHGERNSAPQKQQVNIQKLLIHVRVKTWASF